MAEDMISSMRDKVDGKGGQPFELPYQFIKQITKDYDQELIVGCGSFSTVYKGICENGEDIAVKVLRNMSGIDNKEFQKDFEKLRRLKHQNVVELVGFCNETEKVLVEHNGNQVVADKMHTALCFEYVCNGSLAKHISDDGCSGLNWHIQYKIIKGICQGLEYLRHGLEFSVWHLDLNPANILLDSNMIPKIAGFGLSRLLGDENTTKTINSVGTGGYLPPEYIEHGLITKEYDIFSLGVIIVKLMAGRDGLFKIDDMGEKKFIEHVHGNWRKRLRETLAPRLVEVYCEQVKMCIQIAVRCMNRKRQERPNIQFIVSNLIETEIMIGNLGLQTEQFHDGQPDLPEGGVHDKTPVSLSACSWSSGGLMAEDKSSSSSSGEKVDHKSDQPCQLSHQFIKQITKDYDEALIVGRGSFGTVYKGTCENGEEVAVKVPKNMLTFDTKEFEKEFENLRTLKHQNVVKVVGFCNEPERVVAEYEGKLVIAEEMHTALCFEYVRNGSLDKHIYADGCSGLNWHILYNIIKGICHGLEYLRHGLDFPVWHLDLKPANILLDNHMIPKLADFGLSKLLGDENTRRSSNPVGTRGYLPPEYIEHGLLTREFDIFGLGVIIAKLMAGSEVYSEIDNMAEKNFIEHVHGNWRKKLRETLAPRRLEVYCQQVRICIKIALKCMNRSRQERPTIQSIVSSLIETEKFIRTRGLQMERYHDGELILPEGRTQAITSEMAGDSSKGKTDDGKAGTATVEWKGLPLQLLKKITNGFSEERRIGTGAFGAVYKGVMEDGEMVAVKKFAENAPVARHDKAFINEVQKIWSLKHENIVHLVGVCHETNKKVMQHNGRYITADIVESSVCYEYLPNGDLQKNLFELPTKMDWETRFKIIKGICQGLLFLHSIHFVHMDLKPRNILLDNNMRPRIADFGLSRLFGQEQTWLKTQDVVESYAYIAPEYLYRGEISTKSDIYSLGLLILETTTGERYIPKQNEPSAREFIENVRQNWTDRWISDVSEYSSLDSDALRQVQTCIDIGLDCVQIDRHKRPSIEQIVDKLHGLSQIGSDSLLSLQHQQINFPMEPERLNSSSIYLINSRDDRIAFRLATKFPRRYLTKLPFCGIVLPKCAYTLTMKQKKLPPSNCDDFLTLQSNIALHEDLDTIDPASVAMVFDSTGDVVQEAKVAVACTPLAETVPNQIIDGQNYCNVLSLDVHPTEPWILTSNQRGSICIWNYQTHAEVESVEVSGEPVYSAKFIERQEWVVVGSADGYIYVYSYKTMEETIDGIKAHDSHRVTCLAVTPTHSFVLSASDDHMIKLWDWTNKWQCIRTFEGHYDTVTQVIFDPRNSESFASASLDHTVKIWNIHSATCNITWDGHPEGLLCLHYHPRYFQQFLISGSSDGAAMVWDLETDTCVDTLQGHGEGLSALCWHPELRVLVTGSLDGTVRIWNWRSTSSTYRLENIIGFNLGAIHALGSLKGSTRIVVGCDQGIALMEINVL